jgi:hypothetical protein
MFVVQPMVPKQHSTGSDNQNVFHQKSISSDSLDNATEERVEKGSIHVDYLMTLHQFLSTFSFNNSPNNEILLEDKHYILQKAKYVLIVPYSD